MNRICDHIDQHHEAYGVALFVMPVLLAAYTLFCVGCLIAWVLQ